jgi:hypothetical protein
MAEPELKGPSKGMHFIHRAIRTEADWFQQALFDLAPDDDSEARSLSSRLAEFEELLRIHEDGEDLTLFRPLEARHAYIADTYVFDHEKHCRHGAALAASLDELIRARQSSGGPRQAGRRASDTLQWLYEPAHR